LAQSLISFCNELLHATLILPQLLDTHIIALHKKEQQLQLEDLEPTKFGTQCFCPDCQLYRFMIIADEPVDCGSRYAEKLQIALENLFFAVGNIVFFLV